MRACVKHNKSLQTISSVKEKQSPNFVSILNQNFNNLKLKRKGQIAHDFQMPDRHTLPH